MYIEPPWITNPTVLQLRTWKHKPGTSTFNDASITNAPNTLTNKSPLSKICKYLTPLLTHIPIRAYKRLNFSTDITNTGKKDIKSLYNNDDNSSS
jgi:hypothetical protein